MIRKIYKNCEIHSFEPQLKNFKELKCLEDQLTKVNNFVLGEKNKLKTFLFAEMIAHPIFINFQIQVLKKITM